MMIMIRKLEKYRIEHKITQAELAKELGVAFATVNRWINGKCRPGKIQSYHIDKFLNKKRVIKRNGDSK